MAGDVGPFRLRMRAFADGLENVSLAEIKRITPDEYDRLTVGLGDFRSRYEKFAGPQTGA